MAADGISRYIIWVGTAGPRATERPQDAGWENVCNQGQREKLLQSIKSSQTQPSLSAFPRIKHPICAPFTEDGTQPISARLSVILGSDKSNPR